MRRWRRTARVALVLAGVGVAAAALMVTSPSPAAADPVPKPHDDCNSRDGDTNNGYIDVTAHGGSYWSCDVDLEDIQDGQAGDRTYGEICREVTYTTTGRSAEGTRQTIRRTYCPVDDEWLVLHCRNDYRFGIMPGDDTRRFDSTNSEGIVLIPPEPEAPIWWRNEAFIESGHRSLYNDPETDDFDDEADETWDDADLAPGQGCSVAETLPARKACSEINARKAELREEIDEILDLPSQERHDLAVRGNISRRTAELHSLENVGGVIPDDCWGAYPTEHYEITYDPSDDGLTDPSRLMGWLATILFGVAKMAVSAMLWMVRLGFSFDVTEYRRTVGDFASRIDTQLVHFGDNPLSLFDMAWFSLFAYAGFQAVRGRIGRAGGEIIMAVLLAGVGTVLIGNYFPQNEGDSFRSTVSTTQPAYQEGGYFDSVGDLLNMSGIAMLRVAEGEDANVTAEEARDRQFIEALLGSDPEDTDSGVNNRLHQEFIEKPYYFINYNMDSFEPEPVDEDELPMELPGYYEQLSCEQVADHLLTIPDKSQSWPANFLARNGCEEAAAFNGTMNAERLMATLLTTAVAVIVSVLIGLAAFTLLISKFLVAVFFVALPLAAVMAILPGRARQMAWGWATSLLQLWLAALGMGLIVALLMMGLDAIHQTAADRQIMERWLMILLLVSTIYMLRKRIVSGTQSVAKAVGEKLNSSTTGAGPSWAGAGAGGGASGSATDVNLANADRGAARTGMAAKAGLVAGGFMAGRMASRAGGMAARTGGSGVRGGWRLGRQHIQENRQAKKAQRWHLANTLYAQQLKKARGTQMGEELTQEQARAVLDKRHASERAGLIPREMKAAREASYADQEHANQRHREAAGAKHDHGLVLKKLESNGPGNTLGVNRYVREAATRLGITNQEIEMLKQSRNNPALRNPLQKRLREKADAAMHRADNLAKRGPAYTGQQSLQPDDVRSMTASWTDSAIASGNHMKYSTNERQRLEEKGYGSAATRARSGLPDNETTRNTLARQAREREQVDSSHFTMEGAESFLQSAGE